MSRKRGMWTGEWTATSGYFSEQMWWHHSVLCIILSTEQTQAWENPPKYDKINTHKTQIKASCAGKFSIMKLPRIIYTMTVKEHLVKMFEPKTYSAGNKITALPLIICPFFNPSHGLFSNHKQTHSCRNEAGCEAELCQVSGMWPHSSTSQRTTLWC